MKRLIQLGLIAAAALATSSSAMAALTYGNIGGPGVYFGSGNVDGNWTIETSNNVQTAIRAKDRTTLQTLDGSNGTYYSGQGFAAVGGGPKSLWNYEFSVNLRADNTGTLDFTGVSVTMKVDVNSGAGTTWVDLNVENNWPDTAWWDGSAPRINRGTPVVGEFGAQQSANPMFSDSGFNFNPGPGLYGLMMEVRDNQGVLLSSVTTQVQIPEPSALALVAIALGGLTGIGFASRRRSQQR